QCVEMAVIREDAAVTQLPPRVRRSMNPAIRGNLPLDVVTRAPKRCFELGYRLDERKETANYLRSVECVRDAICGKGSIDTLLRGFPPSKADGKVSLTVRT